MFQRDVLRVEESLTDRFSNPWRTLDNLYSFAYNKNRRPHKADDYYVLGAGLSVCDRLGRRVEFLLRVIRKTQGIQLKGRFK